MKISKRQFCIKYNFEPQWVESLIELGIIKAEKIKKNKGTRSFIDDKEIDKLVEGEHYICCPNCNRKMASVTARHYKVCSIKNGEEKKLYSKVLLSLMKWSEEEKTDQSNKLIQRFKTPVGETTRDQIKQASIRLNSDPDFLKRKSETSKEVQNRPEVKERTKITSKKMWADPTFLENNKKYVKDNIDALQKSAARARKHLKKTSSVHLKYKEKMLERGLKGFITEYSFKYYSIDEADPFTKIAVEVDGCYWHGCSSCGFPGDKRILNIDKRKETFLKNRGWTIIRIKEHELKKNPYAGIEAIRSLQEKIRSINKEKIKKSFLNGSLKVKAMPKGSDRAEWATLQDFVQHNTVNKKMFKVTTEATSVEVTEDHSLFLWETKEPIKVKELKAGDKIVGLVLSDIFEPVEVISVEEITLQDKTYDASVPETENFVLDSGILAHNTYSISGVSLDIEKSSKYQAMAESFLAQWDKSRELIKASIKIIKGLSQPRYGIGISSALGPYSRPGTQSRRNFVSGFRGGWA